MIVRVSLQEMIELIFLLLVLAILLSPMDNSLIELLERRVRVDGGSEWSSEKFSSSSRVNVYPANY
jgi:hypothetical protein